MALLDAAMQDDRGVVHSPDVQRTRASRRERLFGSPARSPAPRATASPSPAPRATTGSPVVVGIGGGCWRAAAAERQQSPFAMAVDTQPTSAAATPTRHQKPRSRRRKPADDSDYQPDDADHGGDRAPAGQLAAVAAANSRSPSQHAGAAKPYHYPRHGAAVGRAAAAVSCGGKGGRRPAAGGGRAPGPLAGSPVSVQSPPPPSVPKRGAPAGPSLFAPLFAAAAPQCGGGPADSPASSPAPSLGQLRSVQPSVARRSPGLRMAVAAAADIGAGVFGGGGAFGGVHPPARTQAPGGPSSECSCQSAPQWRKHPLTGLDLCNACGIRQQRRAAQRRRNAGRGRAAAASKAARPEALLAAAALAVAALAGGAPEEGMASPDPRA
jgi:hypothetical protein